MRTLLREGQRWRNSEGHIVSIDGLAGGSVSVSVTDPHNQVTWGNALHPSAFDSMVLLSDPQEPTWVVTASGSKDMLWGALERIGTIEMSSSHTPSAEGLGPGKVTVAVVGADQDAVRAKVDSVLPRAAGEYTLEPHRAARPLI